MKLENLGSCFVVVLAVFIIMAHPVSALGAPYATAKITNVNVPTTVGVGLPLTIDVTVHYFSIGQILIVDIQDSISEMVEPKAFPTTANTCP
jgi:hypothetical protein